MIIGIGLAVLQQVTGINTILYYAPTILTMTCYQGATGAILATMGIGLVFVIFTVVSLPLIDRLGRRILLIASEWGIPATTVVAGGAGDNAATAISVGVVANGEALLSLGTSGTYFIAADQFHPNVAGAVHTFCHCLPKLWHQMNCHLTAASAMTWWADASHTDVATLVNEAEQSKIHDPQLLFLPYLSGERTPINNPYARAVFFGMTHETQCPQLTQAVLEGVALNFAEGQDGILQSGTQIKNIAVVGGGARSLYWGRILAAALNQPLTYYANREVGGALGAARLAYLAVNSVQSLSDFPKLPIEKIIEPDAQLVEIYAQKKHDLKNYIRQSKHQYDYDTATVYAFLKKFGLEKEFKLNIEGNHATLAGHSFSHEVAYAYANGIFGSVDANIGDAQLGWDMDYFPVDITDLTQVLYIMLLNGGFGRGGFNFDTKVRRQSIELSDLFYGHVGAIDILARALLTAAKLIEEGLIKDFVTERYIGWNQGVGKDILAGKFDVEKLVQYATQQAAPQPKTGRQEMLQNIINNALV